MPKRGEIIHSATVSVTDLGYGSIDRIRAISVRSRGLVTVTRLFRSNEKVIEYKSSFSATYSTYSTVSPGRVECISYIYLEMYLHNSARTATRVRTEQFEVCCR